MTSSEINDYILANRHKSYEELARETGLSTNAVGKRYRELRRRFSEDMYLPEPTATDKPEPTREERVAQIKGVMLERQFQAEQRKEDEDRARFEIFIDTLREAITPLTFTPTEYKAPDIDRDEEALCAILSDLHFGKKTSKYNTEIAKERFVKVIDGIIEAAEIRRAYLPVNDLYLFLVGDLVDGESIYPTQQWHMDNHVVSQIFGTAPFFVEQLARLAKVFRTIHINSVRGNHGRLSKFAHENANWDHVYGKVLEMATANIPNIKWDLHEGWHKVVDVMGVKVLVYHGHQIKMTLNLPWYGITTRISRWATTESIGDFDIAIQGHFHTSSSLRWNAKKIITNGTLVAGDEFALEVLGLESSEVQRLFFVHPTDKVTQEIEIDVR